ncbi:hypothetical protein [Kibdelosporangium aridum]|uniref:hypothetical protein n=1 Tax=Kibdelosporangium aridum TaxID=2030 RepID=UPI000B192B95|nr:hypothetical protein [Kibdelosporangium aridum]
MFVVVLTLLIVSIATAIALLVGMFVKDKPFYGAMGVTVIAGPCSILVLLYQAVA